MNEGENKFIEGGKGIWILIVILTIGGRDLVRPLVFTGGKIIPTSLYGQGTTADTVNDGTIWKGA